MNLVSLIVLFITIVNAEPRGYILTPRATVFDAVSTRQQTFTSQIAEEHNLQPLASFGNIDSLVDGPSLQLYWSSHENLKKYEHTLNRLFEIEEDVEINLDPSDYYSQDHHLFDHETKQFVMISDVDVNDNLMEHVFEKSEVPWHLDRITKRHLPLDYNFPYYQSGMCHRNNNTAIYTYIVDTGIDTSHTQFEGRAVWGANFADSQDTDCNSHGTHVAGLVGSRDYGVCVDANLVAVKVLDCQGSGSLSGVIRGIEWAFKQHQSRSQNDTRQIKGIINMSLGGGYSRAINRAVETCLRNDNNFYIVVAAGNENQDACKVSPASAEGVITVMASDSSDGRAWFSNWGECGNVYAPGVDVLSTIPDGKTAKYSGTSMASPVMAGVLNHYLDMFPKKNQKGIVKLINKLATKDTIENNRKATVNQLVYLERSGL